MTNTYDDLCICPNSKSGDHCWHETNTLVGSPDGKAHRWCVCCECGMHMTRPMPIGTLPQHDAPHGEFMPVDKPTQVFKVQFIPANASSPDYASKIVDRAFGMDNVTYTYYPRTTTAGKR